MNQMKKNIILLGFFAFSFAAQASDFHSPRTAALAGSGHASPLLNDAIYLNPSYTSFLPNYGFSINYLLYDAGNQNAAGYSDYNGHSLNFSIQDGRSDVFQAGVGYTIRDDSKLLSIGASKAVVDKLGIGIGAKLVFPNDGSKMVNDGIFSTTYAFADFGQTAFIIDNIIQSSGAKDRGMYRQFIVGTKFNVEKVVLVYVDPHLTPDLPDMDDRTSNWGLEGGLEFPIMSDVFLRMGLMRNSYVPFVNRYSDGYGLGLGWLAPRLSLDYAFQRVITPLPGHAHTFGITLYF